MPLSEWIERDPLTRGRHGLAPEKVRQIQRGRLLAAAAELAAEHGVRGVTAARLTDRAGISRTTLYDLFGNKDAVVDVAAREALASLVASVAEAARSDRSAAARLETMVDSFTDFCVAHPNAAQLGLVEIAGVGAEGARLRYETLDELIEVFRTPLAEAYPVAPPLTADLLVSGLWHIAGSRLCAGRAREIPNAGRVIRIRLLAALLD